MSAADELDRALYDGPAQRVFCPNGCFKRLKVPAGDDVAAVVQSHTLSGECRARVATPPPKATRKKKARAQDDD